MNRVVGLSKTILRFVSEKGNLVHKVTSEAVDGVTGQIFEGSALVSAGNAQKLASKFNWPIIDIEKDDEGNWSVVKDEDEEPESEKEEK